MTGAVSLHGNCFPVFLASLKILMEQRLGIVLVLKRGGLQQTEFFEYLRLGPLPF